MKDSDMLMCHQCTAGAGPSAAIPSPLHCWNRGQDEASHPTGLQRDSSQQLCFHLLSRCAIVIAMCSFPSDK